MVDLPKLKKKIANFLTQEDGKISKEELLKKGAIIGAIAIGSAASAVADCGHVGEHADCIAYDNQEGGVLAGHSHHGQHSSY